MYTEAVTNFICLIGTIAFAVSGATVAIKKHTDIFGVTVLSVITASGGGIIRDILLGLFPPKIFIDSSFVLIAIITALSVFFIASINRESYQKTAAKLDKINNIFDALGLGVFVAVGAQAAIDFGFSQNGFFVVFIGMITGIGGGILRDIMAREIPAVLTKHIYALAALAGALVFYVLHILGAGYTMALFLSSSVTFVLRMAATYFHWNLPSAY